MSSLLSGPSAITPWIETTVFRSLLDDPSSVTRRAKIVQVLSRGGPGWTEQNSVSSAAAPPLHCQECPSYMVVQDGKTSVVAFLTQQPSREIIHATRGSLVRISDWNVSLSKHCAKHHLVHLLQRDDFAASFLSQLPDEESILCFSVQNIELLGAQGMGIVGNPIDVHRSIDVRRALQSIQNRKSLAAALNLPAEPVRLGNVQQLLGSVKFNSNATSSSSAANCLASLAAQQSHQNRSTGRKVVNGTVLGNVQELLAGGTRAAGDGQQPQSSHVMSDILMLAQNTVMSLPVQNAGAERASESSSLASSNDVALGDVQALLRASRAGNVIVGDVGTLLGDSPGVTMSDILETAHRQHPDRANESVTRKHRDAPAPVEAPATSLQRQSEESEKPKGGPVQALFSAVLQTYNQTVSKNSAASSATPANDAGRQESETAAGSQGDNGNGDSDSDSEMLGISDMLISQTQPDAPMDTQEETIAEKETSAVDAVATNTSSTPKARGRSSKVASSAEPQDRRDAADEESEGEEQVEKFPSIFRVSGPVEDDEEEEDRPGSLFKGLFRQAKASSSKITFSQPSSKRRKVAPADTEFGRLRALLK